MPQLRKQFDSLLSVSRTKLSLKFPSASFESFDVNGIRCERVRAQSLESNCTIQYVHGGGFLIGSIETHRRLALRLAWAAKCDVVTFDYRLSPEHQFPAAFEDCLAVFQHLNQSCDRVVLAGDSAGAGLAISAMLQMRDQGQPLPDAAVLLCPWTNHQLEFDSIHSNRKHETLLDHEFLTMASNAYCGDADRTDPAISPVYGNLQGLPETLIHVSEHEMLRDDAREIARVAEQDGVDVTLESWPKLPHVWHLLSHWIPEGKQAIDKIGQFVQNL